MTSLAAGGIGAIFFYIGNKFSSAKRRIVHNIIAVTAVALGIFLMYITAPIKDGQYESSANSFHSWVAHNYDLKLSHAEEIELMKKQELIVKQGGGLQKLTLENYKDGVVIMNDGKALKQK